MTMCNNVPTDDGKRRSMAEIDEEVGAVLEEIKDFQAQLRHPYVRSIMAGPDGESVLDDD